MRRAPLLLNTAVTLMLAACGGSADVDSALDAEEEALSSPTVQVVTDAGMTDEIVALVATARTRVNIATYEYLADRAGLRPVTNALAAAAARGVRVRVLLDDGISENANAVRTLRALGIDAKLDSAARKTHNKAICVDGLVLLAGSTNLSSASLNQNHETNLKVRISSAAAAFDRYFNALWADSSRAIAVPRSTSTVVQLLGDAQYGAKALEAIRAARREIAVVMYAARYTASASDVRNQLVDALRDAAARGVSVDVILEGDDSFVAPGNQAVALHLRRGGVNVRYDERRRTTHAKLVVADDRVLTGSTNWTSAALADYHATDLHVKRASVADAFRSYFDSLWAESHQ